MKLNVNGIALIAGKDFLVDAASASCKGKFNAVIINKPVADTSLVSINNLLKELSTQNNKQHFFLVAKDNFTKEQYGLWQQALRESVAFGAKGVVEYSDNKLTWDASQDQLSFCYLQVKGSLPKTKKSVVTVDIESEWKKNYRTQNVIGYVKGTSMPDSFLVFTAHYDHLGQMGDSTYFPGANDNASGTSMVLNLAKYYASHPSKYSIAFMFFSGEELGLLGSRHYVNHPLFPLGNIKFLVNLDIVGTGDEGIKVVNGTEFPLAFNQLVKLNEFKLLLKVVSPRGKAANSDHYSFYEKGVPCFFIYTMGGIAAYHDVFDRAETLPLTDYDDLFQLLIDFANTF
ncbi:MAG: M28 family peptidase [Chitinophagaceae bacterium]|nr:M28 family peptidase [Chitinophagaceae bacterium]